MWIIIVVEVFCVTYHTSTNELIIMEDYFVFKLLITLFPNIILDLTRSHILIRVKFS
jgi:hypothetical protein